ncbi:MAG: hypothetical protein KKB22_02755 [Candidatus Omnitrophica bacterium]|nr:hypothetical protein [Candidatus Omnitrophota bacterium]
MKKIALVIIFVLAVSGCVTGAKEVKPSSEKAVNTVPSIEEKDISETQKVFSGNAGEPVTPTPVSIVEPAPYNIPEPIPEPSKIQYSQITNLISEFIDMKDSSAISGENGYLGVSENKLTVFEIKGNKDDVKEASMKLIYPKGIDKTSAELNNAMMSRFLKNIAPEFQDWQGRTKEILDKFHSMQTGVQATNLENIRLSNKIIQILYDKNADYIVVTLKAQP